MKKIIYGNSNFKKIKINNDYLYIDKTKYIEKLENINEDFVIFLRPRRFGKSLFLSTLLYYYDENYAHKFNDIFHDTYIGKNPTPLKSSYRILFFEFYSTLLNYFISKFDYKRCQTPTKMLDSNVASDYYGIYYYQRWDNSRTL